MLLVLSPVAASMSIAAYSVIGEKQARTLEPLLATPITTFELLLAKILGAFLPALALTLACFAVYVGVAALFARPGVCRRRCSRRGRSACCSCMGPMASLTALSSRCACRRASTTRAARSSSPCSSCCRITGLLIAQIAAGFVVTVPVILLITGVMAVVNVGLIRLGVSLFDRETILTRWKCTAAGALNEFGRLTQVAVKHARETPS